MSDIASSKKKVQVESVRFRGAASESPVQTIGGSVNYLIDHMDSAEANVGTLLARMAAINRLKKIVDVNFSGAIVLAAQEHNPFAIGSIDYAIFLLYLSRSGPYISLPDRVIINGAYIFSGQISDTGAGDLPTVIPVFMTPSSQLTIKCTNSQRTIGYQGVGIIFRDVAGPG